MMYNYFPHVRTYTQTQQTHTYAHTHRRLRARTHTQIYSAEHHTPAESHTTAVLLLCCSHSERQQSSRKVTKMIFLIENITVFIARNICMMHIIKERTQRDLLKNVLIIRGPYSIYGRQPHTNMTHTQKIDFSPLTAKKMSGKIQKFLTLLIFFEKKI